MSGEESPPHSSSKGQKRSRDDLAGLSSEEKRQRRCVPTARAAPSRAAFTSVRAARRGIPAPTAQCVRARRLEQNRLAAKRAYNKRVAKQSADHEKLDSIDTELEELRQMVTVQKGQIEMMGQVIALLADPNSAQMREKLQQQLAAALSSNHTQPKPPAHSSPAMAKNEPGRATHSGATS